jgi:hypothetical protein
MANSANGEPLALRNAVVKWSAQSAYGTAIAPATSAGIAMAGKRKLSNNLNLRGPGSANLVARKGGSTYTEWALRYAAVQSGIKTLLTKGVRASGVLPFFTLGIGYEDDQGTSNKSADQVQDCIVNTLELALDAFSEAAPLTANLSGFGGLVTALTTVTRGTLTTTPWMSYEAVFQKEAAAYALGSFNLNVNQNVSRDYIIPGEAPASFVRGHTYATPHDEVITGSISRYTKLGHNVQADTLTEEDILVVFTNLDDAETLTLTLNDVVFDNENEEHTERGLRWSADFEAKTWSLA